MAVKICHYCNSIILSTGYCSNRNCIMGKKKQATVNQCVKIAELCDELGISIDGKDFEKLMTDKASKIISDLIDRKVKAALYGEELSGDINFDKDIRKAIRR